jgi:two-component system chemotaxis response regulator CheB
MPGHDIVVVGGSAGALEAMKSLAGNLPADFPAAVFMVLHISPTNPGLLPGILTRVGRLRAEPAIDFEPITPGRIYIARPDHHLILEPGRVRVCRGPKENCSRPALDPLFRSAALAFGPRVVGVVLSGGLDDGSYGLWAIKTRGGLATVQDPHEAEVPSMPLNALRQARVDYTLPVAEMPSLLIRLASEPINDNGSAYPPPAGLETETRISMEDQPLRSGLRKLGDPSLFACPECHGTLFKLHTGGGTRFRCHTGHAYTAKSLLAHLLESVEDSLWVSVRAVEEFSLLTEHLASHLREAGDQTMAARYEKEAASARGQAESIRQTITDNDAMTSEFFS